jgi:hypothetical protein
MIWDVHYGYGSLKLPIRDFVYGGTYYSYLVRISGTCTFLSLWQVWLSAGARTQLVVDLVSMRQEAARGGLKVHLRGIRAKMYLSLFGHSLQ